MPSIHNRAVHAHASVCVRAILHRTYVISACAQGKTQACVRDVALPAPTALPRFFLAVLPLLNLCLAPMRSSSRSSSHCGVRVDPQPCVCVHVRTARLFCNSYMPLPECVFGHFLLHIHHFCERISHCNHSTRGRTALHRNHARYPCTVARDIAMLFRCATNFLALPRLRYLTHK